MIKVSVIITTHNRIELLKKAIKSVLEQTFKEFECIVIDDASTDETQNYVKGIDDNRLKYVKIEKEDSKGGGYARNLGIDLAEGEYVAFLDDDDEWFSNKLEKQLACIEMDKNIGIVSCGRKIEFNNMPIYLEQHPVDKGVQDYSTKIFYQMIGVTSMMLFRKSILVECGKFDINLRFWQEYDVTIRASKLCKVAFVEDILVLYRQNILDKNRLTNKFNGWLETVSFVNKKYKKEIENLSQEQKDKRQLMIYYDAVNRCAACNNKKGKKEYLKKIYKLTNTTKDWVKYVLNFDVNSKITLKTKLKTIKSKMGGRNV